MDELHSYIWSLVLAGLEVVMPLQSKIAMQWKIAAKAHGV